MRLSNTIVKEADRVGGTILMIPCPPTIPVARRLGLGEEVPTTPEQHRAASAMIADEIERVRRERKTALVPVRSFISRRVWPGGTPKHGQEEQFLCVVLIGSRWVGATGPRAERSSESWIF